MQNDNIIPSGEIANEPALNAQDIAPWQHIAEPARRVAERINCGRKFQRKDYDQYELANFALHIPNRAYFRPEECSENAKLCWVRQGPPAYGTEGPRGHCVGCGGRILTKGSLP